MNHLRKQQGFLRLVVPPANDWKLLQNLTERLHVVVIQLRRLHILLDPLRRSGTWDGDNGRHALCSALRKHPANGNLDWCSTLCLGNVLDGVEQLDVLVENVGLEPGQVLQHRVWLNVAVLLVPARLGTD